MWTSNTPRSVDTKWPSDGTRLQPKRTVSGFKNDPLTTAPQDLSVYERLKCFEHYDSFDG